MTRSPGSSDEKPQGAFVRSRLPETLNAFLSEEESKLRATLQDKALLDKIRITERLFDVALSKCSQTSTEDAILFQLLRRTHYEFFASMALMMRGHMSDAFASGRIAIEVCLVSSVILADRSKEDDYLKRRTPFDCLNRHLNNLRQNGKPLPHALVPMLLGLFNKLSGFASHADARSFAFRADSTEEEKAHFEYFQVPDNELEKDEYWNSLIVLFVISLDVFSDFLVNNYEVPKQWQSEVRAFTYHLSQLVSKP